MQLDKQKKREYCEILGVSENADEEIIKKAYKKLALEFHPDRPANKGKENEAGIKFRKVTDAYEKLQSNNNAMNMLKNVFKSQEIHSSLEHFLFTTGNSVNFQFNSTEFKNSNSGTFSSKIFKKGQSLRTTLRIKFEECLYGCTKTIEFTRTLICTSCGGNGGIRGNLSANSNLNININNIVNSNSSSSPNNKANGNINLTPCKDCGGKGNLRAIINNNSLNEGGTSTSNISIPCPTCSNSNNAINPSSPNMTHTSTTLPSVISSSSSSSHSNNISGSLSSSSSSPLPTPTPSPSPSNSATATNTFPSISRSTSSSGSGSVSICTNCHGSGKMTERKTCTVEVPPGVVTGMQKIFEGEGDESDFAYLNSYSYGGSLGSNNGGDANSNINSAPGDLIVCFEVESHPFYVRKGDDVQCNLPIHFPQACLGTVIDFPSLYGKKIELPIRSGTQHNEVIKLEQEGFLNPERQKRGDMYIQINIVVPKVLDEQEKALLRSLSLSPNFKSLFKCS